MPDKEPRRIIGYKALSPGLYRPSTPPKQIETTAADVHEWSEAVNIKFAKGVPVTLMFTHAEGYEGVECGILEKSYMKGDIAYVDIAVLADAIVKGEVVRTIDQIADGLETGMMSASWEGWQGGYKNETYTGDRTFNLWPTGYAVLPGSTQPAIPPGVPLAADENQDSAGVFLRNVTIAPDGGNSPTEGGHEMALNLEQALEEIVKLKAEIAELKKAKSAEDDEASKVMASENTELKGKVKKFEDAAEVALKVKAEELQKSVLDKTLAAKRDDLKVKIEAIEDSHQRVQFLELMDESLEELEIDPEKLEAGEVDDGSDPVATQVKAAEKLATEKGITYTEALEQIVEKE